MADVTPLIGSVLALLILIAGVRLMFGDRRGAGSMLAGVLVVAFAIGPVFHCCACLLQNREVSAGVLVLAILAAIVLLALGIARYARRRRRWEAWWRVGTRGTAVKTRIEK